MQPTIARIRATALCLLGAALLAAPAAAEDEEYLNTGTPPNHVFDAQSFDVVDLHNGKGVST
jgi:hypothetical protein